MELEFDLIHVEAPIANALRRVLIAEVVQLKSLLSITTFRFRQWQLRRSTCIRIRLAFLYVYGCLTFINFLIQDEVLCHRIGLIPINADPRLFAFPSQEFKPIAESDEVETEPEGNPNEHLIFNFHVCF